MRFRIASLLGALVIVVSALVFTSAHGQEEETTRGGFISSRPASGGASAGVGTSSGSTGRRPRRRPAKAKQTTSVKTTNSNVKANTNTTATVSVNYTGKPIGLGYTLYMRDSNGDARRVDPAREFATGERVRVLMETNADGYLYIFNTTDNGDPVMIYPDVQLDGGGNYMEAHVPFEVPSSLETEERLRWFTFDAKPGIERLYIVLTREPLPGVPIEDDLVNYCRQNTGRCPWRPAPALWAEVRKALNTKVNVVKSTTYGQSQSSNEREATTRGLGLSKSDPEPSVIRMNVSSNTALLVTVLELVHK
jgi:hypothetical protein